MPELDSQQRRLELVEPRVQARKVTDIPLAPPVFSKQTRLLGQTRIVRDDSATIAQRAQVLGRIEAERRDVPPRTRLAAAQVGAMRLGAVFDDEQAVPFGDVHDRRHGGRMTVEMNRDDGLDTAGLLSLQDIVESIYIDRGSCGIDVYQHGFGAG